MFSPSAQAVYIQLAVIGKALSNPVRLHLLELLEQGERSVDELARAADARLQNTSAQLQQLLAANLVTARREGTRVYYRLAGADVSTFLGQLQDLADRRVTSLATAVTEHVGAVDQLRPIAGDELEAHLDDPAVVVVDVRPATEYVAGHVPGAVSIPSEQLRDRIDELPGDARIVAYCRSRYCVLAPDAVRLLHQHHRGARPLHGGFSEWRRAGRALHTGDRP